ncbi:CoA-binding protein [Halalkalibacterium halodurans]|nr:CoA-binding protein [Halalkalibacterium halodurans]MED3647622.1 CoA-binding protein [Halalkalibacterium halodurans]MED4081116.1 CoA-binding protein [Halalkalibacterium halodurans]MED4085719.1 CoA-binding protein [Halalkalibacterium halodurans]MED4106466.1 CoA-binding protein [Halalkalibacterium halodurans]MED4108236.1 CoA-binding protein [Halalkalibacterium halodurans]
MMITNPSDEKIKQILQEAKRIAVVGLSGNPDRTSYMVSAAMQHAGYEIIPVNPTVDEVLGEKAVPSLQDIEGAVDIVNVFRRSEHLPDVARETVEIGAPVFWAQLGLENKEAYDYLQQHGVTSIMNRCIKVEHAKFKA